MNIERLRALYPTLTDKELKEAEDNLQRYFVCAMQIARDAHDATVDKLQPQDTIEERSLSSLNKFPF